jgi:hypothetical protein
MILTANEIKLLRLIRLVAAPRNYTLVSSVVKNLAITDVEARDILKSLNAKGLVRLGTSEHYGRFVELLEYKGMKQA